MDISSRGRDHIQKYFDNNMWLRVLQANQEAAKQASMLDQPGP